MFHCLEQNGTYRACLRLGPSHPVGACPHLGRSGTYRACLRLGLNSTFWARPRLGLNSTFRARPLKISSITLPIFPEFLSLTDADQLRLNLAPLELCTFMQKQVESFGGRAAQRNIRLEYLCAERTVFMQADRQRMAQVLFNLLKNAIRYTLGGGAVTVRLERHSVKGVSRVRLTMEDSGPGIPVDALEHVFERFYRTDVSRSRHSGGSGLGLAIVRSIMALHGGRVWAENRLEGGARLVIQL